MIKRFFDYRVIYDNAPQYNEVLSLPLYWDVDQREWVDAYGNSAHTAINVHFCNIAHGRFGGHGQVFLDKIGYREGRNFIAKWSFHFRYDATQLKAPEEVID